MKPSDERKLLNDELSQLNRKKEKHKDDLNRMDAILKRLKELEHKID